MSTISVILGTLTALEFFYIMYLETFVPTSAATARVFNMSQEELQRASVKTLFKNQGVYNGLLGLGLLYSLYLSNQSFELTLFLLIYIIAVAAYGSFTSDKMILLKQGGLAIATLLSIVFF